jgi:hypothetical protein
MAIDGNFYSPEEFRLAIKAESTLGTKNTTAMQLVNHEGIFSPVVGGVEVHEVRSGTGRTEKAADHYINTTGAEKEFSFSGVADKTVLPMLLSNVMTVAVGSAPASYDIPFDYTPPALTHGAAFSGNTGTLTFAWISPEAGRTKVYPGCVVSLLIIKGSHTDDGGRLKFEATVKTGYKVSDDQATPGSITAYPATFYYIYDMNTTRRIAGSDGVLNGFELTIENPTFYRGSQGSDGDPQIINRGVPGIKASGRLNVIYDGNTSGLFGAHDAGTTTSVEFSNHATWASATTFGFKADNGKLELPGLDAADHGMGLEIPIVFKAGTSGDVIQIIV